MLQRVWLPSPNYSERGGAAVRLIVLHTAEGAQNFVDLGAFFGHPSSGVSSHVGIDDTPGVIGQFVHRDKKSWTAASYNPVAVQAELCAFAAWDAAEWERHPVMLSNTAAWVAEEAEAFGVPLERLTPYDAQHGAAGVCQHVDLGSEGGGHTDCGPAFPIDAVLELARTGDAPVPLPTPEDNMFIRQANGELHWFIADGPDSYWRPVPAGLAPDVPEDWVMDDINGSWLALWRVGYPR